MWCLREAYVKMTGEALVAPWLKELGISDVLAPDAASTIHETTSLATGQVATDFNISFKGKKVTDVKMELSALGHAYMVAASVTVPNGSSNLVMGSWQELNLENDIFAVAELTS